MQTNTRSAPAPRLKVAVVGHVEWVQFARVEHTPRSGEVVHAHAPFEEPAGGGGVAAVQLARLAGEALLITALGDDELGRRSVARLGELGVQVAAAWRPRRTRRAVTLVDEAGERTITTFGPRLEPALADEQLPWATLAEMDAIYFTAGDAGALAAARAAQVLVATPRAGQALQQQGVSLDALVLSGEDAIERALAEEAQVDVRLSVRTEGARGGSYAQSPTDEEQQQQTGGSGRLAGRTGRFAAAPVPGPIRDSYGCGDSFAAGLAYGLGAGLATDEALELAARCGAFCLTGDGPYERQLSTEPMGAL